jgi:hypothetical protein
LRTRLDRQALLRLIELAYAAAEDTDRWHPLLLALTDCVAGPSLIVRHHDLVGAGTVAFGVRGDPEAARLYGEYVCRLDPRALSPRAATLAALRVHGTIATAGTGDGSAGM